MAGLTDYQGTAGIVTGASSGIGAQLARDLAARGMRVALLARRADCLAALADEIRRGGGEAIAVPCDVAERTSIEGAVAGVLERFDRVDLLVNDAGYDPRLLRPRLVPRLVRQALRLASRGKNGAPAA